MDIDHEVQLTILRELLFNPQARFSQLNTTELTNDHFTFHLKHLINRGIVEKVGETYQLTTYGLEVAGRLDVKTLQIVRQPKVGVSICVERKVKGASELLLGTRLRDPIKGHVSFYTQKVLLGESLLETAKRCLLNETGLEADFEWAGETRIVRKIENELVVDVLLTCFRTRNLRNELQLKTVEAENKWYGLDEIYKIKNARPDFFGSVDLYLQKKPFFKEFILET